MCLCVVLPVSEVVQTLQLSADRDQSDVVGDLSVCLDGMTVDPEMFATAEANHHSESGVTERSEVEQSLHQDHVGPDRYVNFKKNNKKSP